MQGNLGHPQPGPHPGHPKHPRVGEPPPAELSSVHNGIFFSAHLQPFSLTRAKGGTHGRMGGGPSLGPLSWASLPRAVPVGRWPPRPRSLGLGGVAPCTCGVLVGAWGCCCPWMSTALGCRSPWVTQPVGPHAWPVGAIFCGSSCPMGATSHGSHVPTVALDAARRWLMTLCRGAQGW